MSMDNLLLKLSKIQRKLYSVVNPPDPKLSPASDLFPWFNIHNIQTYYQLFDHNFAHDPTSDSLSCFILILFSSQGELLSSVPITLASPTELICINEFIPKGISGYGTFSIFNLKPNTFADFNSSVSERGYVSYSWGESPLRSSAHGNLDAVAYTQDNIIQPLGSRTFYSGTYSPQFIFDSDNINYLFLVNPTKHPIHYAVSIISGELPPAFISIRLKTLGSSFVPIPPVSSSYRIALKSRLYFQRPLIFSFSSTSLNVFHA